MPRKTKTVAASVDEPIYNYVRGKGWVVGAIDDTIIIDGILYRVECRYPNTGEHYMMDSKNAWGGSLWFYARTGKPKMKKWASQKKLSRFAIMDENTHQYYLRNNYYQVYWWGVLVPV